MKKFNLPALLLATLVTFMFVGVGAAISYKSVTFILLFLVLGFVIMGYGISKKKNRESDSI